MIFKLGFGLTGGLFISAGAYSLINPNFGAQGVSCKRPPGLPPENQ